MTVKIVAVNDLEQKIVLTRRRWCVVHMLPQRAV